MTDQQLALQAMSDAQRILEEYLEPRPHNDERILDKLVEVLERMVGRAFCRQPGIKRLRNSNRRGGEIFGTTLICGDRSIEVCPPELHSRPAASSPRVRRASLCRPGNRMGPAFCDQALMPHS